MIAFADEAERNGFIPRWMILVQANGDKMQFTQSIVSFVESLLGRKFPKSDRDHSIKDVLAALKRKLKSIENKWLLCVDNADNPEVNTIVSEISNMLDDKSLNGWILITSRQGGGHFGMNWYPEQKLKLEPLSEQHAMIVLWGWKTSKLRNEVDHCKITRELAELRIQSGEEYQALAELAGDSKGCGLSGLPLALVQAWSYIYRTKDPFVSYVVLYKRAQKEAKPDEVFRKIDESAVVSSEQQTFSTTWKINIENLDIRSQLVLRTFASLGSTPIPAFLVLELDDEFSVDPFL